MRWIVCFLIFFGACKGGEQKVPVRNELRFSIYSEPPTLDLRKATDQISVMLIKLCFEGLTTLNEHNEVTLALAESVEISDDATCYTFHLKDALWSDGKPVVAFDFEDTWKTILAPDYPCEFASDLYILKGALEAKLGKIPIEDVGVKALDDRTLHVELAHPTAYFLSLTATPAFFALPSHHVHTHPHFAEQAGEGYVSNGPFLFTEWKHHDRLLFKKNPTYWDHDVVQLEHLSFFLVEDENAELAMFENGEIDWTGSPFSSLPLDAIPALKAAHQLHIESFAATYYYVFNTQVAPLNNVHIRRALSLAVNRRLIVDNITQLEQRIATGVVPPSLWKGEEPCYFQDHDTVEAQKELKLGLEELKISLDELPVLCLSYNTLSAHHKIAQAIQEQWQQVLGVKVQLQNREWKVFLDELSHHQFSIARMGGSASFEDPMTFLDLFRYLSSSNNYSQWSNATFTQLLDKADACIHEKTRFQLLKQAEKLLISQMPILPIYFYNAGYLKKPYVQGVFLSNLNDVNLKKAYIDTQQGNDGKVSP